MFLMFLCEIKMDYVLNIFGINPDYHSYIREN